MQHVSFLYTFGMDEDEVTECLAAAETGVLSLARDDEAYGIPVHLYYDGEVVWLRLGEHEDSEKLAYLDATDQASLVVYDATDGESWSVLLRGDLVRAGEGAPSTLNERFGPMRVFGEDVDELAPVAYRFDAEEVTGRRTDLEDDLEE
jgi:hypothetical protein